MFLEKANTETFLRSSYNADHVNLSILYVCIYAAVSIHTYPKDYVYTVYIYIYVFYLFIFSIIINRAHE